jgi:hypothetical protein
MFEAVNKKFAQLSSKITLGHSGTGKGGREGFEGGIKGQGGSQTVADAAALSRHDAASAGFPCLCALAARAAERSAPKNGLDVYTCKRYAGTAAKLREAIQRVTKAQVRSIHLTRE